MTALQTSESLEVTGPRATVATTLNIAMHILTKALRERAGISVAEFLSALEDQYVTDAAANDTLRFLQGTGVVRVTEFGDIEVVEDHAVPAV